MLKIYPLGNVTDRFDMITFSNDVMSSLVTDLNGLNCDWLNSTENGSRMPTTGAGVRSHRRHLHDAIRLRSSSLSSNLFRLVETVAD